MSELSKVSFRQTLIDGVFRTYIVCKEDDEGLTKDEAEEVVHRCNCHDDLLDACQGGVLAIHVLLECIAETCKIANIPLPPPPPLGSMKTAIKNAGGEVYETAEQAEAALAKVKKES